MKTRTLIPTIEIQNRHRCTVGGVLSRRRWMSVPTLLLFSAVFALAGISARASDPIGVFAKIDKVVFEPSDAMPERVQVWGAFCVADTKDRDSYLPPQRGYLYYKLPATKAEAARMEWNDFKAGAGSGDVIGFGSRHATLPKVRNAQDKPENPDAYSVGFGLVKAQQRSTSYPPIKALLAEGKKASVEAK